MSEKCMCPGCNFFPRAEYEPSFCCPEKPTVGPYCMGCAGLLGLALTQIVAWLLP